MNETEKQWLKDFLQVQATLLHDINNGILLADSVLWHMNQYRANLANHHQPQPRVEEEPQQVLQEAVSALEHCSKKLRSGSHTLERCYRDLQTRLETPVSPQE